MKKILCMQRETYWFDDTLVIISCHPSRKDFSMKTAGNCWEASVDNRTGQVKKLYILFSFAACTISECFDKNIPQCMYLN